MGHSTKTSHTAERKAGKTTHTEVISVLGSQLVLELPVDLVTAKRGGNDGSLIGISSDIGVTCYDSIPDLALKDFCLLKPLSIT